MKFLAHDKNISKTIRASSWNEAERIARANQWVLDGRLYLTIPAIGGKSVPDFILFILWFIGI